MYIHISDTIVTDVKEVNFFYSNWLRKIMGLNKTFFLWVCRYRNVACIYNVISLHIIHTKMCFDLLQITEDLKY